MENIKGLGNSSLLLFFLKLNLQIFINTSHKSLSCVFIFNIEDEEKINLEKKEDLKKKKKEVSETAKAPNLWK